MEKLALKDYICISNRVISMYQFFHLYVIFTDIQCYTVMISLSLAANNSSTPFIILS